ncbi:DNA-binding protein RHL1 [Silene latifolia]|uniref:DNA-binding protein RHL1 n=1 Tax=Silene latifolia TaxID=37657 RepID=UPI003D77C7BA
MAKEKKTKKTNSNTDKNQQQNPETEERTRLKTLAYTNQIISETPAKPVSSLNPSKTLIKHHGKDIVKKSQRKSRYLFSFSGLLAPISGGKIGELTALRSKNPILYLEFPQGRMKLFGTIVYPKNRYLTLQFSKGGKNVICEDCFDNVIVFSEGYWVGNKDENPDEARLDIPEELYETKQSEFDFQGGAGATVMQNKIVKKPVTKTVTEETPSDSALDDMDTESPERQVNPKDIEYTTPVRHSKRTAGKKFKFNEVSSGDDSPESISDTSAKSTDEAAEIDQDLDISEKAVKVCSSEDIQMSTVQVPSSSMLSSGEKKSSHSGLVQTTIATLFKKVEQKNTAEDVVKIDPTSKKIAQPSSSKSKNKTLTKKLVSEAAEQPLQENISQVRKQGTRTTKKKGKSEVDEDEDDIEEISSSSEVGDESDDDWRA